jgi:hypothetical protein
MLFVSEKNIWRVGDNFCCLFFRVPRLLCHMPSIGGFAICLLLAHGKA